MQVLLDNYVAVLLATVIGFLLVASAILGSRLLAPYSQSDKKKTTYECGMIPAAAPVRSQIHMRDDRGAILGRSVDVEAVFLDAQRRSQFPHPRRWRFPVTGNCSKARPRGLSAPAR